MTAPSTATEQAAIEQAIRLYIDGASKGDAAKLKETFHEAAWMLGSIGGQRFDMPIAQMIETLAAQPLDSNGEFSARLTAIEQVGDAATVRLEEEGCWGNISFGDFFTCATSSGTVFAGNDGFATNR